MKTENRFEMAEASRAALQIKNQPAPSNVIRITRYKAGQVVEIIERTETGGQARERKVFTASKTRAKPAAKPAPLYIVMADYGLDAAGLYRTARATWSSDISDAKRYATERAACDDIVTLARPGGAVDIVCQTAPESLKV